MKIVQSFVCLLLVLPAVALGAAPVKFFNPDMSADVLGLYQASVRGAKSRTAVNHNGASLQEAELHFTADVDTYFHAAAILSIAQKDGTAEFGIAPEEVYAETISLPVVSFRVGKFKSAFGKHNTLHKHSYPFIDAPLINQDLLGEEGLNEVGGSVSILMPTPWFLELTLQGVTTSNEKLFKTANSGDFAQVAALRNLWELSDALTLEWGLFSARGSNQFAAKTIAYGSDLIFKWRPVEGGKYHAIVWQSEYLAANVSGAGPDNLGPHLGGVASWLQWQFAQRWWAQARVEYEGLPKAPEVGAKRRQGVLLGFFPSEFTGLRLQYDRTNADNLVVGSPGIRIDHRVAFQVNFSIGAHPAHAY